MRIIVAIMMIIMIKIMIKIRVMIIIIMIRQRKIILCIAIVMMRMMVINIMAVPNGFASYHFPALSSLYFPHNFQCINLLLPSCRLLYSFCTNVLNSLARCSTLSLLSSLALS